MQIGKEEVSLLANTVLSKKKTLKIPPEKCLVLINTFSKVVGFTIKI